MKRASFVVSAIFLPIGLAVGSEIIPPHNLRAEAAGCVTSALSCGMQGYGELAVGDCTFSDGTRYDVWRFEGRTGDLITVKVEPLDASLTNPLLLLDPPIGDASKTPTVAGAGTPTISYVLGSSGQWTVGVGTLDLFAGGRYRVSLLCQPDPAPSEPQNCVDQALECAQSFDWFLTATSCRFTQADNRAYAYFFTRLSAGDLIRIVAHSNAFDPGVAIYRGGGSPLASAWGKQYSQDAAFNYDVPASDEYQIAVYGPNASSAGEFFLAATCPIQCQGPAISREPIDQTVRSGDRATLSVDATGTTPLLYAWHDAIDSLTTAGVGQQFVTPPLTTRAKYFVNVSNACGITTSRLVTIDVQGSHRHAVKH